MSRDAARPLPRPRALCAALFVLTLILGGTCLADGGVTFHDYAAREGSGIDYARVPSAILSIEGRFQDQPSMTMGHVVASPEKPRGAPGVALIDFDLDGDVDVYVTNGPGAANSLYANQLEESGELGFRDVARRAGVTATAQDSTGVCFGDTDNDGDPDLLVLGRMEANRFFENRGDGTFVEITAQSGLGKTAYGHASCSMGDVDNDGLLDVAVANSFDWAHRAAIFSEPYALNHPNNLYRNLGKNRFTDVSEESGLRVIDSVRPPIDEGATMTWAVALVDYDQDGDVDLLHADDQAAVPVDKANRAHVHVFRNDGTGHFTNITLDVGTDLYGAWMGLAFADFNCDGHMDFFATNFGDYGFAPIGFEYERGQWSSRWFLGDGEGGFVAPGLGDLRATPFGWAPMSVDYDNDADTDVIYLGSLGTAVYTIINDNPGAVLQNPGCTAKFRRDAEAMTTPHHRRVVEGAAAADLDRNGFVDVVSVSSHDIPASVEQVPYRVDFDSPFDATAVYTTFLKPAPGGNFVPQNRDFPNGGLVIDLNSGGNGNGSFTVRTLGTVGLTTGGAVNRSGIGAVVHVRPEGGPTSLKPVKGGTNYASQDALENVFGLGKATRARVEVLWPGGVRNRLYGVEKGERLVFPEIPCSFTAKWAGEGEYKACVNKAMAELGRAGVLDPEQRRRFRESALRAYREARGGEEREEAPRPELRETSGGAPTASTAATTIDSAELRRFALHWLP